MEDVLYAMDKTNLHGLGLSALDESIYARVVKETSRIHRINPDKAGFILPNENVVFNAREYNTREGLHVLTIGYSYDEAKPETEIRKIIEKGLENKALVVLDHPFVDNIYTKTAGHISEELGVELEKLCSEYPGQIAVEWNGYCIPWMRLGLLPILNIGDSFLGMVLNSLGEKGLRSRFSLPYKTEYYDVNKKAEELAEKYNLPLLADTDLHARAKKALEAMGTSRFIVDVEGDFAAEIVDSMKRNIFARDHENVERYVSGWHLFRYFCLPVLFDKIFKKPRA